MWVKEEFLKMGSVRIRKKYTQKKENFGARKN
jgi:hypothetical protein